MTAAGHNCVLDNLDPSLPTCLLVPWTFICMVTFALLICAQVSFRDSSKGRLQPKLVDLYGFTAASLGPSGVAYISPAAGEDRPGMLVGDCACCCCGQALCVDSQTSVLVCNWPWQNSGSFPGSCCGGHPLCMYGTMGPVNTECISPGIGEQRMGGYSVTAEKCSS
jgi:hypothetical protein